MWSFSFVRPSIFDTFSAMKSCQHSDPRNLAPDSAVLPEFSMSRQLDRDLNWCWRESYGEEDLAEQGQSPTQESLRDCMTKALRARCRLRNWLNRNSEMTLPSDQPGILADAVDEETPRSLIQHRAQLLDAQVISLLTEIRAVQAGGEIPIGSNATYYLYREKKATSPLPADLLLEQLKGSLSVFRKALDRLDQERQKLSSDDQRSVQELIEWGEKHVLRLKVVAPMAEMSWSLRDFPLRLVGIRLKIGGKKVSYKTEKKHLFEGETCFSLL